ncbi:hypothetical protein FGLOB1_2606 [Fusarium globosum]|uniref:Uncharacterized protein n=1 Tax=Fusarium globosum TaxID=78864 RepID=A0A8H5YRF8_9HYPO|nr:hypothetical protein FGLOB1_2606 [Fusarium globosum]
MHLPPSETLRLQQPNTPATFLLNTSSIRPANFDIVSLTKRSIGLPEYLRFLSFGAVDNYKKAIDLKVGDITDLTASIGLVDSGQLLLVSTRAQRHHPAASFLQVCAYPRGS